MMWSRRYGWASFTCIVYCLVLFSAILANAQNCDPCIERSNYVLKAILHGGTEDPFWMEIQAAMRQAALDMRVQLDLQLAPKTLSPTKMAEQVQEAIENRESFDALIVTVPGEAVKTVVQEAVDIGIPVFGLNLGSEDAKSLGVKGFVAQDEYRAGKSAAEEFAKMANVSRALFINSNRDSAGVAARSRGFADAFAEMYNATNTITLDNNNSTNATDPTTTNATVVDEMLVDPTDVFQTVTQFNRVFEENCRYDAVMVGDEDTLMVALAASKQHNCGEVTQIAAFGETPLILNEVLAGTVSFGVSQQHYLQGVLPVYMASIYVTTKKTLALPVDEDVYLAGPNIIKRENVPNDALQQCAKDAFPICPNTKNPSGEEAICECTDKQKIRIGGVLHGITTDAFWDPVFASAQQAAMDMDIELDLIRFQPDENNQVYFQMAARIKALCEDGVDGIFVTIPTEVVIDSIKRCKELKVPVVSVNAGGGLSLELDLLNHVGMVEYSAGYGAGTRMLEAGMKKGYCLQHEFGNLALIERCQGFEDAINDYGQGATFEGSYDVSRDNKVEYGLQVEAAVGDSNGDWEGVGLILTGASQVPSYAETVAPKHPKVLAGSFDVSNAVYEGIEDEILLFGIDQVPYLQGNLPVYTLAIEAYTKQVLKNHFIETGPSFVLATPSDDQVICENNFYQVCPERPEEEYNRISEGLHIFGFASMGLLLGLCALCFAWTYLCREQWVVRISQPLFLYVILFGTVVSSIAILFLGFETDYRFIQDVSSGDLTDVPNPDITTADVGCMAVPWFYGLGFAITFSALFAKIQRVRLIYHAGVQMRRKRVQFRDVANIMIVIVTIEAAILLAWQLYDPHRWEREVLQVDDGFTTESYGYCASETGNYFWIGIVTFHVICLLYALVLAFQTKDINAEYAESGSLFLAVMFMFQTQVLVIPLVALVQDDANVFFFIRCIAVFLQNFTVLILLFVPKMYKSLKGEGNVNPNNQATRTSLARMDLSRQNTMAGSGAARIYGLNMPPDDFSALSSRLNSHDSLKSHQFNMGDMNGNSNRSMQMTKPLDHASSADNLTRSDQSDKDASSSPTESAPSPISKDSSAVATSGRSSVDVWSSQWEKVEEKPASSDEITKDDLEKQ